MKSIRACLAALAIATMGVLASPAAPAQAGPWVDCLTIVNDEGITIVHCIPVGALQEIDWCKGCPWGLTFKRDDLIIPESVEIDILDGIKGLALAADAA